TLHRRLHEQGLLIPEERGQEGWKRLKARKTVGGKRRSVLWLRPSFLDGVPPSLNTGPTGPSGPGAGKGFLDQWYKKVWAWTTRGARWTNWTTKSAWKSWGWSSWSTVVQLTDQTGPQLRG